MSRFFMRSNNIKTVMTILVVGLVTTWGAVSPASADLILDDPHIVSGGITPKYALTDVYLVANLVTDTPLNYVQMAFPIGDVPGGQETTFEFTIPDPVDDSAKRYYTVMAVTSAYNDVNLGFTPTTAADLITNGTSWATYFSESFQPTEASVVNWLDVANKIELGGFLNDNSGTSPHKLGVGLSGAYGSTVAYKVVDFCSANDNGDTWVREGRIPEPFTMLLLAPGMFYLTRRKRKI